MIRGIAILGLNGCGKSTLAHALAKKLNFYEMDVEDYYFSEQEESRKKVLDNNEILSHIDIAFWIQTPIEERMQRIQMREEKRFGNRVLPGGDMHEQQERFRQLVAGKDISIVEESIKKLHCPVYVLDGMQPIEKKVEAVLQRIEC